MRSRTLNNNTIIGFIKSRPRKTVILLALIVIAGVVILLSGNSETDDKSFGGIATFTAKRGPLTISITESGTIKARNQVILKSQVEGRTSIITLIPEGTRVKKGDLLVKLDASSLLDKKIDQEIRVQNAEAAYIGAKEDLAVVKNQAESDIDKAELTLEFAGQDLEKYIEGEYPNELKEAEAKITLAHEEVTRAREKLKWSTKLYAEKYISQTELQADELAEKRKALDLELARNNRDLLKNFTHKRELAQLESDLSQAEMALERTIRKAKARVIQAEASLRAKKAEDNRQKDKLKKLETQIEKTTILAPTDGLVIYATSARSRGWRGSQEPLDEGQEVRERQELIYLPTADLVKAEVDIHESSLEKVRIGLPAIISVDALPGRKFFGKVAKIAPLPDAQSVWMNPDLKVYNTDIYLENNNDSLRTGMSCQAEIIIEQYADTVYIPVQAVLRVGKETTVYVVKGRTLKPRKVETGLDNNRMIRIISGLEEGEVVSLTPPLKSAAVEQSTDIINENFVIPPKPAEHEPASQNPGQKPQQRTGSTEEREKMRQRFKDASPEEREKMRTRKHGANRKRKRTDE